MVKKPGDFSPSQVAHLLTFLAWQISRGEKCLSIDKSLLDRVIEILTRTDDNSHCEERQQALIDMLNAKGIKYFDGQTLRQQAESIKFFRVLEMLYEDSQEHEKILRYVNVLVFL